MPLTEYEQYQHQQQYQQAQQQMQQRQQQQQQQQQSQPQHYQQQQQGQQQQQQQPSSQQSQQQPQASNYPPIASNTSPPTMSAAMSQHYPPQGYDQPSHPASAYPPNYPPHLMPRPQPNGAQPQPSYASNPAAAYQQFNPNYYQAMPQPQMMHPAAAQQQAAAAAGQQPQYLQPNPYLSAQQLSNAQNRPLLVAGRIIPHPQFYPYELKPGRMPPFDLLAAQLHKKKVNLACHFCDHAARRPGRQKTALLISCQSPHCRKVFCSRPSCFKKLPAELGIQSPDRFCEWKRQVESGVAGMTFICPHCRDEAACPGPQCAKRWKKRLARANNKRGVGKEEGDEGEGEEAAAEQPMKKEVILGNSVSSSGSGGGGQGNGDMNGVHMNGNGMMMKIKTDDSEQQQQMMGQSQHEAMYAHPAMMQIQQAVVNGGGGQQRSPSNMAPAGAAVAYPTAGAMFKPYSVVYQAGDPNAQPRTSMDVLAGVSNMGEVAGGDSGQGSSASSGESAPDHQQLLQFIHQHHQQKQQEEQAQESTQQMQQPQSAQQGSDSSSQPGAPAPTGYALSAYPAAVPASAATSSAAAISAAAAGQYAYNGAGGAVVNGQPFFTSPQLSPLMSPQPTVLAVPSSMMTMQQQMGNHTPQYSSSNSPTMAPLSPMHQNQSPATAFYAANPHLVMTSVPSLSLAAGGAPTGAAAGGEMKKASVVEVGGHAGEGGVKSELNGTAPDGAAVSVA